ncbi:Plug domain-containing protein [Candidatus Kuenenia sp.]|uniref:TonB-dependent receptor plug domain-containing protein n=1 Tax=Candidatus Kuenenia sp. TaxID=2499824 RepID=UPI00322043EE
MRAFVLVVIFLLISYYTHYTHSAEAENDSSLLHTDTDIQNPADTTSFNLLSMNIEDLMEIEIATVYAASKYKQKVTEAPSSVSIVTVDDIKKYGYRTLADILRSIRGLYVTYDRNYSYLVSMGFLRSGDYNSRYLSMVDGLRLNDAVYDTASIGTEFVLDVDLIDRVEVIRGPGSSLYGSNAFSYYDSNGRSRLYTTENLRRVVVAKKFPPLLC